MGDKPPRRWALIWQRPGPPAFYKDEPSPKVAVDRGPLLEKGEIVEVMPVSEHHKAMDKLRARYER